jgi:hypothetical protein
MDFLNIIPHNIELRTLVFYVRTLMIPFSSRVFLDPSDLLFVLRNPSIGLRVSAFEHIAAIAKINGQLLKSNSQLVETILDVNMETAIEEANSRRKLQFALGNGSLSNSILSECDATAPQLLVI